MAAVELSRSVAGMQNAESGQQGGFLQVNEHLVLEKEFRQSGQCSM